jgi:hypothetical protein
MESRFLKFVIASAVFMTVLLLVDRDGLPQQLALGMATVLFLWYFARSSEVKLRQIVTCIVVATIGEVVLSIGWGLYSYRHAVIPFYVPPGHGLFYTLAAETARQHAVRMRGAMITRSVVIAGSVIAIFSLVVRNDVWGFLWWIGAVVLIAISKNRLLLSSCFVYTIILEWVGTAIGNWRWAAEVPGLRLHSANPPSGVGILYILLDLIVVAITSLQLKQSADDADARRRRPILHLSPSASSADSLRS